MAMYQTSISTEALALESDPCVFLLGKNIGDPSGPCLQDHCRAPRPNGLKDSFGRLDRRAGNLANILF